MSSIIPTIFAKSKKQFEKRFDNIINLTNKIQIDFMDGKFVKAKSLPISEMPNLKKYKKNFEAHLMLYYPEKYIKILKEKGFSKIIFHIESTKNIEKAINLIKQGKLKVFLAINPETPINSIIPYLSRLNGVLFLGVHPGKEHQFFIPKVYKKIEQLRKINKKIKIQVDGGVNEKSIKKLAKLGVNLVNSGSFISQSHNSKEAFNKLNASFEKYKQNI